MKNIKKSIRNFLTPLIVAGGLISGSNSTDAQDFRIPLGLDFIINNPSLPINCRDRAFLNSINRINYLTALRNSQQVHIIHHYELDRKDGINDGFVDPDNIPQAMILNYWLDSNKDGGSSLREYIGLNKQTFRSNEKFHYGIHSAAQLTGSTYEMKVYSPDGKYVGRKNDGKGNVVGGVGEKAPWGSLDLESLLNRYGEGRYAVVFYLNDQHWDTKQFELVSTNAKKAQKSEKAFPNTYIGHWCENDDANGDNRIDYNEFKKLGEKRFNEGERISFGVMARNNSRENLEIKIFSKNTDELIHSQSEINEYGSGKVFHNNNLKPGKYYTVYKIDGKYLNTIPFEIVDENSRYSDSPPDNRKVIVEPLGVFEKASKPY